MTTPPNEAQTTEPNPHSNGQSGPARVGKEPLANKILWTALGLLLAAISTFGTMWVSSVQSEAHETRNMVNDHHAQIKVMEANFEWMRREWKEFKDEVRAAGVIHSKKGE